MLCWWLKADVHINEDDYFQQNLALTIQAMAMDYEKQPNRLEIAIHKEVENELNVVFDTQKNFWLSVGMTKMIFLSTGRGDLYFRLLFATSATTFLLAEAAAKALKVKLTHSLLKCFGISLSSKLVTTGLIGVQGDEMPDLTYDDIGKPFILQLTTDDKDRYFSPPKATQESLKSLQVYEVPEVTFLVTEDSQLNFYLKQ